jgi:hypothetical protein
VVLNCIKNDPVIALKIDPLELAYLSDQRRILAFQVGQSQTQISRKIGSIFNAIQQGDKHATRWGPMKTLQECQEEMAKFLGKFGEKIINPRCVKK